MIQLPHLHLHCPVRLGMHALRCVSLPFCRIADDLAQLGSTGVNRACMRRLTGMMQTYGMAEMVFAASGLGALLACPSMARRSVVVFCLSVHPRIWRAGLDWRGSRC